MGRSGGIAYAVGGGVMAMIGNRATMSTVATFCEVQRASRSRCELIEIPLCKDIPYKYTYFPNSLLQPDQQSLQTQTEHFKPLIKTNCNPHIKFFICSVFAPMCPEHMPQAVTSCRSVCEEVF
ncbi:Frizzled-4 [Dirofilaria immitis]|nr:Frizzled-4 [Dirofilaria immitis]